METAPVQPAPELARVTRKSKHYRAGGLEVVFTYWTEESLDTDSPKTLPYTVERLTVEEADALKESQPTAVVDADSLKGEKLLKGNDLDCYYIAGRGTVLKILLSPGAA